jgi:rubrerythrin
MAFSEQVKQKVKKRARFKCCLCRRRWGTHVHHIKPESESGPDTEDNAAPLCADCHGLYGGNPDMRKFIKQNRDFWYETCDKMHCYDREKIDEIASRLSQAATKEDLERAVGHITNILNQIVKQPNRSNKEVIREISDVTAAISDVTAGPIILCTFCGFCVTEGGKLDYCPQCGKSLDVAWT